MSRNIGPKKRFEVFQRDNFTCCYCGRKTPQVVLEVDHMIPVSEDGTDDLHNLVTSCWECNRGKGASLIESVAGGSDLHEKAVVMLERELQLKEYNAVKRMQRERQDQEIADLYAHWDSIAPGGSAGKFPYETVLRKYMKLLPVEDIKEAMDIAMARAGRWNDGCKYLAGILKNWVEQRGGDAEE